MSSRYVLAWDLSGRRVLIVGGGAIGEGKVETLLDSGAEIVVVGPTLTPRLTDLHRRARLKWLPRRFCRRDVLKCRLVISATEDEATNQHVARWARRAGAVVNVVDDPSNCDVIVPAALRCGPATISVTTDGATPAGARFLRETIEAAVPTAFGEVLEVAAAARHELRDTGRYRYDYPTWKQRLFDPGLQAVRAAHPAPTAELHARFVGDFALADRPEVGHVTLVGAGPGGRGMITVAGAEALAAADVVVYDRLADPELLDLAPIVSERIPVGKSKGQGTSQDDINQLLIDKARLGFDVVRLKGGDPLLFGRGIEETDALTAAGVGSTIIPGVSAALGAPALAGIPVTHRDMAASVTIISGHRAAEQCYDWFALADGAQTIIVMMGASTASVVAGRLLMAGRPLATPVAVCHRAGTPETQTALLTLQELEQDGCPFPAPCVLVIGDVAAYATATQRVPVAATAAG